MQTGTKALAFAGILAAVTLGLGGMATAQQKAAPPAEEVSSKITGFPDWMAGSWIEEKGDAWSEEYWTASRGDIMLGVSRTGKGPRLATWEHAHIRLNAEGKLALFAMPRGAPASEFPAIEQGAQSIIFENKAHDYPQRIRYWREGELLKAEISLADGSKAHRWTMQRLRETH